MIEIKSLRKELGLTQAKMSELLHIPKRTIENWDCGVNKGSEWLMHCLRACLVTVAAPAGYYKVFSENKIEYFGINYYKALDAWNKSGTRWELHIENKIIIIGE